MTTNCGKKETEIWRLSTSVDKKKQVSAAFSSLKGQAREGIAGLDINKLSCDQEIENLIQKLDMNNLRNFVDQNKRV